MKKKRKQMEVSKFKWVWLSVFCMITLLNIYGCTSKIEYKVLSIYLVPNSKYNLIRVREVRESVNCECTILSENKNHVINGHKINVDDLLKLELKQMATNPLIELLHKTRGDQTLYINNIKVYDPNDIIYYADCLNGLFLIEECR